MLRYFQKEFLCMRMFRLCLNSPFVLKEMLLLVNYLHTEPINIVCGHAHENAFALLASKCLIKSVNIFQLEILSYQVLYAKNRVGNGLLRLHRV